MSALSGTQPSKLQVLQVLGIMFAWLSGRFVSQVLCNTPFFVRHVCVQPTGHCSLEVLVMEVKPGLAPLGGFRKLVPEIYHRQSLREIRGNPTMIYFPLTRPPFHETSPVPTAYPTPGLKEYSHIEGILNLLWGSNQYPKDRSERSGITMR